jgi:hypothetical protein
VLPVGIKDEAVSEPPIVRLLELALKLNAVAVVLILGV